MATPASTHENTPGSATTSARERLRSFGRAPRIVGLDIARGLAVLGMAAAHTVSLPGEIRWSDPATWVEIVAGRSSILFAVLAGVSIALMTGRSRIPSGHELATHRLRLVARGLVIFAIGLVLELLGTNIAVILTFYGAVYAIGILFIGMRVYALVVWSAAIAVAGPALAAALLALSPSSSGAGISFVLGGAYSIVAWTALMLAGLALGRLDVTRTKISALALVAGIVLSGVGYTAGSVWEAGNASAASSATVLTAFFSSGPHTGGTMEILGSGGLAIALIALLVLTGERLRYALLPLAAVGSMPLSAYTAHVVAIWIIGPGGWWLYPSLALGLLVLCSAWAILSGRGPLERLTAQAAVRLATPEQRAPTA